MNGSQSFDAKKLSSRKLWKLVTTGSLTERQQRQAEQELSKRRRHLECSGSLYQSGNSVQGQPCHLR